MKEKHAAKTKGWSHRALHRAAAETWEASDLLALSADELVVASAKRSNRGREKISTVRTHQALQQTRSMLEQAARAIQRARTTFAPLGLTSSPF